MFPNPVAGHAARNHTGDSQDWAEDIRMALSLFQKTYLGKP